MRLSAVKGRSVESLLADKKRGHGWALRRDEFIGQIIKMHQAWNATRGQLPLRDAVLKLPGDPEFLSLLKAKKYAVLQIKAFTGNGTVRLLTGDYYTPTLEKLKDEGYSIILGGREPMLEEFKRFDVFNYPRSKFVCPKNDFFLFAHAALGLVSPSGAGLFCDTLGIPCCQIGSWTLIPHPSEKTLMVPCRLRERAASQILTFSQQAGAVCAMYDEVLGPAPFDYKTYEDIPPSADEILQGAGEAQKGAGSIDELARSQHQAIKAVDSTGMWKAAASRMSSSFLARHPEYLS